MARGGRAGGGMAGDEEAGPGLEDAPAVRRTLTAHPGWFGKALGGGEKGGVKARIRVAELRGGATLSLHGVGLNLPPVGLMGLPCARGARPPARRILRDVSAVLRPGRMVALMGPSGAGKTSLLDVFSGRVGGIGSSSTVTGRVLLDGEPLTPLRLMRDSAYVPQRDAILPAFTAREAVQFTALLQLRGKDFSVRDRLGRAEQVLRRMGLGARAAQTRVGAAMSRGLSGGEVKRVSLALGLLNDPQVLLCDEPTSGLDSATALDVMRVVASLAHTEGKTICVTIHQPSPAIFALFDDVLALKSGQLAYFGPAGDLRGHLMAQGLKPPSCVDPRSTSELLLWQLTNSEWDGVAAFAGSLLGRQAAEDAAAVLAESGLSDGGEAYCGKQGRSTCLDAGGVDAHPLQVVSCTSPPGEEKERTLSTLRGRAGPLAHADEKERRRDAFSNGFIWELFVLCSFRGYAHFRDPHFLGTRLGLPVIFALIVTSFWATFGAADPQEQVMNTASLLFITVGAASFTTSVYVPSLVDERPVFIRERLDACYRVLSYGLHKVVLESVAGALAAFVYCPIVYFACGLAPGSENFLFFMLCAWVINAAGVMATLFVAAASPSVEIAGAAVPLLMTLNFFVSGFMILPSNIPSWWQWLYQVSFAQWGFSALAVSQFSGRSFTQCEEIHSPETGALVLSPDRILERAGGSLIGLEDFRGAQCHTADGPVSPLDLVAPSCAAYAAGWEGACGGLSACERVCVTVQADNALSIFGMVGRGQWESLGWCALSAPVFAVLFCLSLRYIRHDRR